MSFSKDFLSMILIGTPNVVAYAVVHGAIFSLGPSMDEPIFHQLALGHEALREGDYHQIVTSMFVHCNTNHLTSNLTGLTPFLYRCIATLYPSNKKKSVYTFWSVYFLCGVMGAVLTCKMHEYYKQFLLFYFRNNEAMLRTIHDSFDEVRRMYVDSRHTTGASIAIYGTVTFTTLLSVRTCAQRMIAYYEWLTSNELEEGEEDWMDATSLSDHDHDHVQTQGNDDDASLGGSQCMEHFEFAHYQGMKIMEDWLWCMFGGWLTCKPIKEMHEAWTYGMQQRGNFEIMQFQSSAHDVHFGSHLAGVISGTLVYILFEIYDKFIDIKRAKIKEKAEE